MSTTKNNELTVLKRKYAGIPCSAEQRTKSCKMHAGGKKKPKAIVSPQQESIMEMAQQLVKRYAESPADKFNFKWQKDYLVGYNSLKQRLELLQEFDYHPTKYSMPSASDLSRDNFVKRFQLCLERNDPMRVASTYVDHMIDAVCLCAQIEQYGITYLTALMAAEDNDGDSDGADDVDKDDSDDDDGAAARMTRFEELTGFCDEMAADLEVDILDDMDNVHFDLTPLPVREKIVHGFMSVVSQYVTQMGL
jgi:hypothetical protein